MRQDVVGSAPLLRTFLGETPLPRPVAVPSTRHRRIAS